MEVNITSKRFGRARVSCWCALLFFLLTVLTGCAAKPAETVPAPMPKAIAEPITEAPAEPETESPEETKEPEAEPETPPVLAGDEQPEVYMPLLEGKRIALFTNQTGILKGTGEHILDVLMEKQLDVSFVLCPEHGFRGNLDAGAEVKDDVDEKTGIPLHTAYGEGLSKEELDDFDVLVVDIQDVGLRYYTYYISMFHLMENCAEAGKEVVVLDRPNPNGFYVDGPLLQDEYVSQVGALPIPVVHGMTLGELSLMINGEGWLGSGKDSLKLTVVPCQNYTHQTLTEITVNPSPNLRDMRAIYLYASTCFFENTAVSVGRGTEYPFTVYGSPYLKDTGDNSFSFTPKSIPGALQPPYENEECFGRDLREIELDFILQNGINLTYLCDAYRDLHSAHPEISFFGNPDKKGRYWLDYLTGSDAVRKLIEEGKTPEEIEKSWEADVRQFRAKRAPYLLYEDRDTPEEWTKAPYTDKEQVLAAMSTKEKLAQMCFIELRKWNGEEVHRLNKEQAELLDRYPVGGVCLFKENCRDVEQILQLNADLQQAETKKQGRPAMFISADQEGGWITRLETGCMMPGNMALGAAGDPELAKENAVIIAEEMKALGFNMDFAPDADVLTNPDNTIIGIRSFSDDPELTAKLGKASQQGFQEQGVIPTLKHFPGHGNTATDSHTGLPEVDRSFEELKAIELIPFQECIRAGADMIMTAHIRYPQLEQETRVSKKTGKEVTIPATLSRKILTDLLRKEMGYQGVVITDALYMQAVSQHFDPLETNCMAIEAGADMLLMNVNIASEKGIADFEKRLEDLEGLTETGELSMERIDESVLRILTLKEKYGLLTGRGEGTDRKEERLAVVGSEDHHNSEWEITKKTVTLVKNENDMLPLSGTEKTLILCTDYHAPQELSAEFALRKLKEEGIIPQDANVQALNYTGMQPAQAKDLVNGKDNVIAVTFTKTSRALNPAGDEGASKAFLDAVIDAAHERGGKVLVISSYLPYDLAGYEKADALMACYLADGVKQVPEGEYPVPRYGPNLVAAFYEAFGGDAPTGKLPVRIPALTENYEYSDKILFERGFGLNYR